MRKYSVFFLVVVNSLLLFCSCTNDGDIGDLYGRWQLTDMQVSDSTSQPDDLFLSFQSSVVFFSVSQYELHNATDYRGGFQHRGDSLIMKFVPLDGIGDNLSAELRNRLGWTDRNNVRLHIDQLNKSRLRLSRGNDYWSFRAF